jgi:hypothetical protein
MAEVPKTPKKREKAIDCRRTPTVARSVAPAGNWYFKWHPDWGGGAERFREIQQAYERLKAKFES